MFYWDSVIAQQCLNIDNQQLLSLHIQCDITIHCKTFVTSCKETVQLATQQEHFIHLFTHGVSIHKRHVG